MYIPNTPNYEVGDNITCISDGFPMPIYQWSRINCPDCGSLSTGNVLMVCIYLLYYNMKYWIY